MTEKEFAMKANGAPWDYHTFAVAAECDITEDCELKNAAMNYRAAICRLEDAMDAFNIVLD